MQTGPDTRSQHPVTRAPALSGPNSVPTNRPSPTTRVPHPEGPY